MRKDDLDKILQETEIDSAKMVLRLASELREKELEIAALRARSFEEIQRNNKAKEAEFEALIRGQEADIRKRESEIARLLVETESRLWQKHQGMLEDAISRHRSELEEERARLKEEVARKESEVLEQKKNLRLEMEAVFKKWEKEREEDFANERRTFIEELKLGRDTARREAQERAAHIEALWKEKLERNAAEASARHALELEEAVNGSRREHLAATKEMSERLNAEIRKLYSEKEEALTRSRRETEETLINSERALEEKRVALENEFAARAGRLKDELTRKEERLNAEFAEASSELRERFAAREKALEVREAAAAAEREELAGFREQTAETVRRREAEMAKVFEDRFALLKASMEESSGARELELARQAEETRLSLAALTARKDEAQARAAGLSEENRSLKRLLGEKDAALRLMEEKEHERTAALRKSFEEEFALRSQELRARLEAEEERARKDLEERLRAETERLEGEHRIKEEGVAAQRALLNSQAEELQAGFMNALRAKEREQADALSKALAAFNARLNAARDETAGELTELKLRSAEELAARETAFESGMKEKELRHERRLKEAERRLSDEAARRLELELAKAEDGFRRRISELESRCAILDRGLSEARVAVEEERAIGQRLREEIGSLTLALDRAGHEKQALIQTGLSQAKDIRLALEKEFLEKLSAVEKNYLAQLDDAIRRGEESGKERQYEYFKKLASLKDDWAARNAAGMKEMETEYLEREARLRETLEEGYKLKEKSLFTHYAQMERNYEAALSEKTMQLDNDRSMAESVARLKSELEARNAELNSKMAEYDRRLEETRSAQEASYASARKDLETEHRIRTARLEKERAKLKDLLQREQSLVSDLQKREAAMKETYAAKEAGMAREFELARERLEKEYRDGPRNPRGV